MAWQIASDIARRLIDLREAMGWTQPELGREVRRGYRQVLSWEKGKVVPSQRVLEELAEAHEWPVEIFAEGGPMPSVVIQRLIITNPDQDHISGQELIESLRRDPDYALEGSGLESQLSEDEALDLLMFNRQGFTRYLMTRFDSPRPLPVAAKLGFLDLLEGLARERGIPVPQEHLDHLRGLIRGGGL